jgi:diguanylate cyclase (GGDEF)-like protein/PAS domain S-box-containing protein
MDRQDDLVAKSRKSNRWFLQHASDGILILDIEGNVIEASDSFCHMLGYKRAEVIGMNVTQWDAGFSPAELAGFVAELFERPESQMFEARYRRKDGSVIDVEVTGRSLKLGGGPVLYLAARDITERKRNARALAESETRFRRFFEENNSVMVLVDPCGGTIVAGNLAASAYYGYEREQLAGMLISQINRLPSGDITSELQRAARKECSLFNFRHRLASGEERDVEVYAAPMDVDGKPLLHCIIHDITERTRAQEALRASEARYRTAFQTSLDSVNINRLDDGTYVEVNEGFSRTMGYERQEVIGRTSTELSIWVDSRDRERLADALRRESHCRDLEAQFRKKDGEVIWGLMSASAIEIDGASCVLSITRDISDAKHAEEEIKNLSFYDSLTGLPNRRLLLERLRHILTTGNLGNRKQALLFIDLDNFKTLNDTLGHQTGDLLLLEVAQRLTVCVREAGTVARPGADEFLIILEGLSGIAGEAAAQAKTVAEKILAAVARPCLLAGHECIMTASIGITVFGNQRESIEDVLQQADIAMYQAKDAGRNTMRFFAPALQAAVNARAALEEDLRRAIKKNQFLLYYQPQVDCNGLVGVEALIRWKHPKRGILLPDEFIPLAEETDLILPLGDWVLETACAQIALWAEGKGTAQVKVAVNMSARQFRRPDFVKKVLSILERSGANPQNLELELTEGMLLDNVEDVIAKMTALKSHGVRFSLDDFGTGYSSLSYLKRLPLDLLKIDRSFIRDMVANAASGAIVQAIVSMSRAMGLAVIAEGVETEQQRDFLSRLGCHSIQGYLFGHPLPLEEFNLLLSDEEQRNAMVPR